MFFLTVYRIRRENDNLLGGSVSCSQDTDYLADHIVPNQWVASQRRSKELNYATMLTEVLGGLFELVADDEPMELRACVAALAVWLAWVGALDAPPVR